MTRRDDLYERDPTSHELTRLNYDIQNHIYAHKGKQNAEILSKPWTRIQMSPSGGEPLKELMADQNVGQRTKQLPSMEVCYHRPGRFQPVSTNSSSKTRLVTRETKRKSLEMA